MPVERNRFPEIIAKLPDRVEPAVKATADRIAASAKQRVSVESGDLQRAIHVDEWEGALERRVIAGDGDVFYGHMVEHGTSHSAPQPFLIPAVEENRDFFQASVIAALRSL